MDFPSPDAQNLKISKQPTWGDRPAGKRAGTHGEFQGNMEDFKKKTRCFQEQWIWYRTFSFQDSPKKYIVTLFWTHLYLQTYMIQLHDSAIFSWDQKPKHQPA